MANEVTTASDAGAIMEQVLLKGDLSKLTPEERANYYSAVCKSVGLNPLTRPLEYITLQGKLTLYARRDCADQLRKINAISIEVVERTIHDGLLIVHVRAKDRTGRTDEDFGALSMLYPDRIKDRDGTTRPHPKAGKPLDGEELANAILKCITKAKRRVTLSISGMGFLDETEVETIPDAQTVTVAPAKPTGGGFRMKAPSSPPVEAAPAADANTGEILDDAPDPRATWLAKALAEVALIGAPAVSNWVAANKAHIDALDDGQKATLRAALAERKKTLIDPAAAAGAA